MYCKVHGVKMAEDPIEILALNKTVDQLVDASILC